jgi:hypothetical protein
MRVLAQGEGVGRRVWGGVGCVCRLLGTTEKDKLKALSTKYLVHSLWLQLIAGSHYDRLKVKFTAYHFGPTDTDGATDVDG